MARFGRGFPPSTQLLSNGSFDPNAPQQVEPGLIDNSGTLFGPTINQTVVAALIASTLAIFTPNVNQAVAAPLIASNTTVHAPTINRGAGPEFVQSWSNANSGAQTTITVTLSPQPTAGSLLVAAVASDKSAGTYTPPTGFTVLNDYVNTSVSGSMAYKIADGTESSVVWSQSSSSPAGLSAWVGEYTGATSLDVKAEAAADETVVTSRSSGTTGTTSSTPELGVAMMAADTNQSVDLTREWSNGFAERSWVTTGGAGSPGLSVADKYIGGTGTVETTFTTTDIGDQMYAQVATFSSVLTVSPGLINQSGVTFAPTVNQSVAPGLINNSGVTFDPNVRSGVNVPLIDQTALIFTPQVNQSVQIDLIGSTVVLFTPAINQAVTPGIITQLGTTFDPQVAGGVAVGLIDQSGVVFAPQIIADQFVDIGLIDQGGVLFGPTVNQQVQVPLLVGGPVGDLFISAIGTPSGGLPISIRTRISADNQLYYRFLLHQSGSDVIATIWREDTFLDDSVVVAQVNLGPNTWDGVEWALEGEIWGEPTAVLTRMVVYKTATPTNKTIVNGPAHSYPSIVRLDTTDSVGTAVTLTTERLHTFPLAQVNQSVAIGLINNSGVTFDPRVNQSVTPGLINQSGVTFSPNVNQSVVVPLIGSTISTFDPAINQQVQIPLVDQTAVIFDPIVQFADVQNVFPGLIDNSGVAFAPVIRTSAAIGLIDQSAIIFAPRINQQINVGLIGSTVSVFAPTVTQVVTPPLIGSNTALFEPTLNQRVVVGLIDNSGVAFSPNVQRSIAVGLISNLGVTFAPTAKQQVNPGQINQSGVVFAPTVLRKDPQSVSAPLIDNTSQVFGFHIAERGRKKGGAHVIEVRPQLKPVEAEFEFRWNVLALVDSAVLLSYQNYGFVLAELQSTWRTGAVVTDDRNVTWAVLDLDVVTKTNRMILAMEIDPDLWLIHKKRKE
jgi:hypothetical protein